MLYEVITFRDAHVADLHIRAQPYGRAGRQCELHRAPEHDDGAVDHRGCDRAPDARGRNNFV